MTKRKGWPARVQRQLGIRTNASDNLPLQGTDPLAGFDPTRLSAKDTLSARATALSVALEGRWDFKPHELHRFGALQDGRWALLVVRDLKYVFAWETPGPVKRDYSKRERSSHGYLRIVNPLTPVSQEEGERILKRMLSQMSLNELRERFAEVRAQLAERDRRYAEFDKEIDRYGGQARCQPSPPFSEP
jgi:hypothetical protein